MLKKRNIKFRLTIGTVFFLLVVMTGANEAAGFSLGLRGSWFLPKSVEFRDSYQGGFVPGANIYLPLSKGLNFYLGGEYFSKAGQLTFTGEDVKINVMVFSGGLRQTLSHGSFRPYLAAGVCYFMYSEKSIIGEVSGSNLGYLGELGLLVRLSSKLDLNIFGKYDLRKAKSEEGEAASAELGGLFLGAGFVFRF